MIKNARWLQRAAAVTVLFFSVNATGTPVAPGSADEIRERLKPFGTVCRAGDPCSGATAASGGATVAAAGAATGGARSGEQVYNTFCFACHAVGVGGAPKLGDVAAWTERLAKGDDVIWASTINGLNAMPAKGTCMDCSDDELRAAIDFMSEGS